jgi:hypothetical protein
MTRASFLPLCIFAAACAGAPSRERTAPADLDILFLGNSHTAYHDLPDMVVAMLRAAHPGRAIDHVVAPGWLFLDERLHDPATLRLLRERRWDVVVLQAQRTSSSGRRTYSTAAAESLIELARDAHALPILFPEWPRHGVAETDRIYELHVGIAAREPACVAPVGQAWDLAPRRLPRPRLARRRRQPRRPRRRLFDRPHPRRDDRRHLPRQF